MPGSHPLFRNFHLVFIGQSHRASRQTEPAFKLSSGNLSQLSNTMLC